MRVVLLSHYYEPEAGPPQRRWAAFVPALVAAGHEVTAVVPVAHYPTGRTPAGTPGDATRIGRHRGRHGETVVRVPYVPYGPARAGRLLDQLVSAVCSVPPAVLARPRVVVATAPALPTLLAGVVVATLTRARLVVEMRDAWPDLMADAHVGPRRLRPVISRLVTAAQRRADAVITVSDRFARTLRARGARQVVCIRNGVDLAATPPLPPPPQQRDRLEVYYVGTVGESQAVHRAVEAVRACPEGTVRLTVVGTGAGLADVRRAAAGVPGEGVRVLDAVPHGGVRPLLTDADTLLVSLRDWSAFRETVPSKLYEALAIGRHVSAAVRGEAADIVRASGAGDVVDPEEPAALAKLWLDLAADRARLDVGGSGRQWVEGNAHQPELTRRLVALVTAGATA